MNSRERFHRIMRFEKPDRLPLVEWAVWWDKTIDRWHTEGLPADITDRYALYRYFGLEQYLQDWVPCIGPEAPKPVAHGAGVLPGVDDYEDEYAAIRPQLFQLDENGPVDSGMWTRWAQIGESGEAVLWFTLDGFFWLPRELFGIEDHLYSFFDYPELMHRMNQDLADWMIRVIDRICECAQPDFMTFAEDMSYNHGPMLSEEMFDEFMLPYYQQVIPHLKKKGILPFIDSDGDVARAAPWFARAGIDGILPLERQAGVDLAAIRKTTPEMRFIGHFDKLTMSQGEAAMRAEFERLLPLARQGGFIISCDHQTPPEVSLENYQLYLRLFREYAPQVG
jgi:hypothetical protein